MPVGILGTLAFPAPILACMRQKENSWKLPQCHSLSLKVTSQSSGFFHTEECSYVCFMYKVWDFWLYVAGELGKHIVLHFPILLRLLDA